jgi:CubicO group peptidase (beta-lactamase class C family)
VKNIDLLLGDAVASGHVPGVVAMASSDSGVIYQGAFGKRSLDGGAPMTLDTVVWLASMTKAITSTAAMQLVEAGKLRLEQDAGELLPQLASPQVLEGMDGGKPRLRPAKGPITLRHLLTHTSGYSYEFLNPLTAKYREAMSLPPTRSCRNVALEIPLAFDPGERWEYGIGIDWLGKIVEAVSGHKLDRYLQDNILEPLGMSSTAFKLSPDMRARLAAVHQRATDGVLQPIPFELPQEPEFHMGGGGLYGTAADYIRFARMILNRGTLDGERILRPQTVELMAQNHIGELVVGDMKSAQPQFSADVPANPAFPMKWGLGFIINAVRLPTGRSAGSLAWAGLANTYYWIDPARKIAGVVLCQLFPFYDPRAAKLAFDFESAIYRSL